MTTAYWIIDPSHGWLAVTDKEIAALGFGVSDFSDYSYRNEHKRVTYLEEDCDAPKFIAAWERAHGAFPQVPESVLPDSSDRNEVRRCYRLGDYRFDGLYER